MNNTTRKILSVIWWILSVLWLLMAIACLFGSVAGFIVCLLASILCALLGRKARTLSKTAKSNNNPVAAPTAKKTQPATANVPTKSASNISVGPKRLTKTYKVTGMQYYKEAFEFLATENADFNLTKKELIEEDLIGERIWKFEYFPKKTELIPEPENPHDKNAIKVIVDDKHVGYIKSGSCSHLLNVIREGRIESISCNMGCGPYKYIREDYDEDKDKEVYTLERDTVPAFVHLSIVEIAK